MADARCPCGQAQGPVKDYMRPQIARLCIECRQAIWRMKDRKRRGLPAITDQFLHTHCECGAELQQSRTGGRRRCEPCRIERERARKPERWLCRDCGRERGERRRGKAFRYCDECAKKRRQASNRRKNTRRRTARLLGQDDYTTAEIGERDGWQCHLCGRKIDKNLSGDEWMGPTVDHLIPISDDDGHDVRSNVAIAHRSCNLKRSNTGPAQLRLIG